MTVTKTSKKTGAPQIVKLNKALKLVSNLCPSCHMYFVVVKSFYAVLMFIHADYYLTLTTMNILLNVCVTS